MFFKYLQFNYFTIPLYFGIILVLVFAFYIARVKPTIYYRPLIILSIAAILWMLLNCAELLVKNYDIKLMMYQLSFVGICLVPVSFFIFVMQYSGYSAWQRIQNILLISVLPISYLLLDATNNFHKLIIKSYSLFNDGRNIYLIKQYGLFFWIWTSYAYFILLVGFFYLFKMLVISLKFYKRTTIVIMIAAILPICANIIYLTGWTPLSHIDFTPLALPMSIFILLVGVIKMNLGNVIPIAKTAIIDSMRDGVVVIDNNNQIIDINPIAEKIIGLEGKKNIGKKINEVWPQIGNYLANISNQPIGKIELSDNSNNNSYVYYEVTITANIDYRKNISASIILLQDITEREKSENILKNKARFSKLIARISASFISVSPKEIDKRIDKVLRIIGKFAGVDRSYVFLFLRKGKIMDNTNEWAANGISTQKENLRMIPTAATPWFVGKLRNFEDIYLNDINDIPDEAITTKEALKAQDIKSIAIVPMIYKRELLGFLGFDSVKNKKNWTEEDVSLLRIMGSIFINAIQNLKADKKIRYLSYYDNLTGLYNRAYFEEELKRLNTARQLPLSIVIGDINGLKLVNDAFGHFEGDKLLKDCAKVLKKCCRADDMVARWGGDEFAILLPKTSEKDLKEIIERIKNSAAKTSRKKIPLSISVGTFTKTSEDQDIITIIKKAEDLMYRRKLLERNSIFSSLIASLERTLWEKSHETQDHAKRLQQMSVRLGQEMNLAENVIDDLSLLATLHDIGKIAIPEEILQKKSNLNAEEWEIMKRHAEIGYNIIQASPHLVHLSNAILSHHEHWDGNGYPQKLKENKIPIISRILSVVDAFDVMTNGRPYRKATSKEFALEEIERLSGKQFDPHIVEVFLSIIDKS